MAWQGEIRVPRFQRDFRWRRRDVSLLWVVDGPIGEQPRPARTGQATASREG